MSPQTNNTQHLFDAPQSSSTACRSCVRTPRLLNPQHPWHRAAQVVRKVQNSTTFVRAGQAIRPSALVPSLPGHAVGPSLLSPLLSHHGAGARARVCGCACVSVGTAE